MLDHLGANSIPSNLSPFRLRATRAIQSVGYFRFLMRANAPASLSAQIPGWPVPSSTIHPVRWMALSISKRPASILSIN